MISESNLGPYRDPDGQESDVFLYELSNGCGSTVSISTLGAALVGVVQKDRNDDDVEIVYGPKTLVEAAQLAPHYVGVVMGRFGRIIADSVFHLEGKRYPLTRNAGQHHLHGGTAGFDRFNWKARTFRRGDALGVLLNLLRPDGDQGYPGDVRATVLYALDRSGALHIETAMRTNAPTIGGLVCHPFWNLSETNDLDDLQLEIFASKAIEMDADFVPTGKLEDITNSDRDFRTARSLAATRLDLCYALPIASRRPILAARLRDSKSGRVLEMETSEPCFAVYTGDGLAVPRRGICLQAGPMPDAPNQAQFCTAVLRPERRLRQSIRFRMRAL